VNTNPSQAGAILTRLQAARQSKHDKGSQKFPVTGPKTEILQAG